MDHQANVVPGWLSAPVVQVSQVGYHPAQPKVAIVELDRNDPAHGQAALVKITENGEVPVQTLNGEEWGQVPPL